MFNLDKLFYLLPVLLIICSCKQKTVAFEGDYISGNYFSNIYKADSLMLQKEYDEALKIYDETFNNFQPFNLPIYYELRQYTKCLYLLDRKKEAKKNLKKLISAYGYTRERIQNDIILKEIWDDKISGQYSSLRSNYLKSVNSSIWEELYSMQDRDQKYRRQNYIQNKSKQDSLDRLNLGRFLEIMNTNGYPNEKIIGTYFNDGRIISPEVILLHSPDSIRKRILPKILEFVRQGDCNPIVYGRLVDQMYLYGGKPQKFGTYLGSEMIARDSVELNRKRIGLPSLSYREWRKDK